MSTKKQKNEIILKGLEIDDLVCLHDLVWFAYNSYNPFTMPNSVKTYYNQLAKLESCLLAQIHNQIFKMSDEIKRPDISFSDYIKEHFNEPRCTFDLVHTVKSPIDETLTYNEEKNATKRKQKTCKCK